MLAVILFLVGIAVGACLVWARPDERCDKSRDCPIRVGRAPRPDCTGYDECDHALHLEG